MVSWKNDLVNENGFQRNIPQICVIFVFTNVRIRVFEFFFFSEKRMVFAEKLCFSTLAVDPSGC